jgi:hypothetical protein
MTCHNTAALEAAFFARRCALCGAQADVVCIGSEGEYRNVISGPPGNLRPVRRVIVEPRPEINLCLPHAAASWAVKQATRK